ncbi:hypothetical protein LINGRAHAP2_LOCUS4152 [Linum grandiflorum]
MDAETLVASLSDRRTCGFTSIACRRPINQHTT